MEFGTYITFNGRVMCFATDSEAAEYVELHKDDEE